MHLLDHLRAVTRLRLAIRRARDLRLRHELREVEVILRRGLPPGIPKRVAARLLGVSVTALDGWIDRGRLPVVAYPRSTRLAVETAPLLDLAAAVEVLRARGLRRGVLARALDDLAWPERGGRLVYREEVARLPRPNETIDELRSTFAQTTPEERVLQLAGLHRSLNRLATVR